MKRTRIDCILVEYKRMSATTRFDTMCNDSCALEWVGTYTLRE